MLFWFAYCCGFGLFCFGFVFIDCATEVDLAGFNGWWLVCCVY